MLQITRPVQASFEIWRGHTSSDHGLLVKFSFNLEGPKNLSDVPVDILYGVYTFWKKNLFLKLWRKLATNNLYSYEQSYKASDLLPWQFYEVFEIKMGFKSSEILKRSGNR